MIRVAIVDDHLIVRDGLRLILGLADDIEIVGEAADGQQGIDLAREQRPDVMLMDLRMPGVDGLTAIERIRGELPDIAIVILTTYNEDDLMLRGLRAGARGFLLKDTDRQTLLDAIRAAARGETLLQPEILQRVLAYASAPREAEDENGERENDAVLDLTERELEVLTGVARGQRNKEIARRLGVTERTVKAHLTNIYNKLGVDSRAAAVTTALQNDLLDLADS